MQKNLPKACTNFTQKVPRVCLGISGLTIYFRVLTQADPSRDCLGLEGVWQGGLAPRRVVGFGLVQSQWGSSAPVMPTAGHRPQLGDLKEQVSIIRDPVGGQVTTSPANGEGKEARDQSPWKHEGSVLAGAGHITAGDQRRQESRALHGPGMGGDTARGGRVLGWTGCPRWGTQGSSGQNLRVPLRQ